MTLAIGDDPRRVLPVTGAAFVPVCDVVGRTIRYPYEIPVGTEGQLIAEGPTADLVTPELLREVFDVEVEVHELAGRRIGVPWS